MHALTGRVCTNHSWAVAQLSWTIWTGSYPLSTKLHFGIGTRVATWSTLCAQLLPKTGACLGLSTTVSVCVVVVAGAVVIGVGFCIYSQDQRNKREK